VSHPAFEPHPIQGWTPDFIPLVLQEAIDGGYFDELIPIPGGEGMKWAQALAAKEGIMTGVSGGATFAAAMAVAGRAAPGSVILAMLPDTSERYLTTPLFEPFGADMNAGELEISRSTPGYLMG
jgi:cysteine synthase A